MKTCPTCNHPMVSTGGVIYCPECLPQKILPTPEEIAKLKYLVAWMEVSKYSTFFDRVGRKETK